MNTESESAEPASNPSSTGAAATSGPGQVVLLAVALLAVPAMIFLCLVAAVLPGVPWWLGIPLGVLAAGLIVFLRYRRAVDHVLAGLGVAPAKPETYPRYHNIVEGLSLAGGVGEPDLYLIDDDGRNAVALAQGDRCAIVASTGLLESLDRISLEGVVAETLVRIKSGDAEAATLGTALFGGLLAGPLASVARPAAAFGLRRLLSDNRDLAADRAAVALTRYPPGLLSALTTMRAGSVRLGVAGPGNEHIWLVPPATVEGANDVMVAAAPLDLRIDILGEL